MSSATGLSAGAGSHQIPRVVLSDRVKEYIVEAVLNGDAQSCSAEAATRRGGGR